MDFVATYQKIRINTNHKQFTCNHLGEIWGKENDDFKRFLLRVAFLQDNPEPKPWERIPHKKNAFYIVLACG